MSIISGSLAPNVQFSRRVLVTFSCDSGAAVGDLVYQVSSADTTVEVATDNEDVRQVIGVIDSKPMSTMAEVLLLGVRGGYAGLTRGSRVYLGLSGEPTTSKPSTGYLHNLGIAVSSSEVLFIPNNIRVMQV